MKHLIPIVAVFLVPVAINAQTEAAEPDSIAAHELQEVVVEAPRIVHKADMDVFYPSSSAVEHSKNGMQLVRNLMIPSVSVNEVMGTVKTSGENVQLRINGREASIDQVKALLPETIKRVEWLDNPGLRYKDAVAVLNFVVINPTVGGSFMADIMHALNCAWAPDQLALKLNNGRSQWGASVNYKLTNKISTYREYTETYTFANGESLTRDESPRDGYTSNNYGSIQLDYSYVKPDTTTLWVALYGFKEWSDDTMFDGIMSQSNGENDIHLRDFSHAEGFTPTIQAYFEQQFAKRQTLAIDLSASAYNGRSDRSYTEHDNVTSLLLNDVNTNIKDRNQAYGIEANYIKKWENSNLTAGLSYSANRNRSTYENLGGEIYHQRQDRLYYFAEYFQRIRKVTLTGGIGAQYTNFKFRETGQGNNSWNLRPKFSATYRYNPTSLYSLSFTTWQSAPSLSETNIAVQQTDGIQWSVGNPNLNTSSSYLLTLRYKYTSNRVNGTFSIRAYSSPNAIAPYLYWQDDRLVTSYENSCGLKSASFTIAPQIEIIPDWLSADGDLQFRIDQSKGNGYKHINRNWNGSVTMTAYHWGFYLYVQYEKAPKQLSGEKYIWGETISTLMLGYQWNRWSFSAGMLCPFNKYDVGYQSLNRYNSNTTHRRLDMAGMPLVKVTYNLQWGHQKSGVQKIVDSDAQVDTSTARGR